MESFWFFFHVFRSLGAKESLELEDGLTGSRRWQQIKFDFLNVSFLVFFDLERPMKLSVGSKKGYWIIFVAFLFWSYDSVKL